MKKRSIKLPSKVTQTPNAIPTYVINLKKRTDRREHALKEFKGRREFSLTIVEAFEHSFGALALWITIRHILQDLVSKDKEFVIICEDDIEFTAHYSKKYLLESIEEARKKNADILLGGVSWFSNTVQISENIYWADDFSGLHFTIIFKKFFDTIIQASLANFRAADYHIAALSRNVMFLYPFLSVQKEFGYSDATEKNNTEGKVTLYFEHTGQRLLLLSTVKSLYKKMLKRPLDLITEQTYDEMMIPTYIINLPDRKERLHHIKQEFSDKPEFDVSIVEACKHEVGALGLWLSIRKVIQLAIDNDDDVIIICEDDHEFTSNYSKEFLLKNIIEGYQEGICFLSGGAGKFEHAIPITLNRFWVNYCLSTQFIVIYKAFFSKILERTYDEKIVADIAYSMMATNKMILYPFISIQKDFGYSDITAIHNEDKSLVTNMFERSNAKLNELQTVFSKYQLHDNHPIIPNQISY